MIAPNEVQRLLEHLDVLQKQKGYTIFALRFLWVIVLLVTVVGIVFVLLILSERLKDKLCRTERSQQPRKLYPLCKLGTMGWGFIIWGWWRAWDWV